MSSSNVVTSTGGGRFEVTVNGQTQKLNLADLNMLVRMEQVKDFNDDIATHLSTIQSTNRKRDALNALLKKSREFREEGYGDDAVQEWETYYTDSYGQEGPHGAASPNGGLYSQAQYRSNADHEPLFKIEGYDNTARSIQQWEQELLNKLLTDVLDGYQGKSKGRSEEWDKKIAELKDAIDNVTSESESQMLKFRQITDKRAVALQEAKTSLSSDKRLRDVIAQTV